MGDTPSDLTVPTVPGTDDQYRKPAEPGVVDDLRNGAGTVLPFLMPVGGNFLGDMIADGAKVNEKDPSWEEVITMVVIPGRPASIRNAAQIWKMVFDRMEQAVVLLADGIKDLESWEGEAGAAYRANLAKTVNQLKALIDEHKAILTSLEKAAGELETAIAAIPIPDDMAHEVEAAKQDFHKTGKLTNGLFSGAIFNKLLPIYSNKWVDEMREMFTPERAANTIRDWISNEDDKAKAAYHKLAGEHVATMDGMPQGKSVPEWSNPNVPPVNPTVPTTTGKKPTVPTTHLPDPNTHLPNTQHPNTQHPDSTSHPWSVDPSLKQPSTTDLSSTDPSADFGSGLAGAGSGGLTGAGGLGAGAGGLGPGSGGLGAGAGGLGAGGLGPGAGGLGAGAGGLGAGTGGRAGAGRGGLLGGGMGGAGHGAGGDEDEHSTWLTEDEDVWGSDTDAAPPVLGA